MCCRKSSKCSARQRNGTTMATFFNARHVTGWPCPPGSSHENRASNSSTDGASVFNTLTALPKSGGLSAHSGCSLVTFPRLEMLVGLADVLEVKLNDGLDISSLIALCDGCDTFVAFGSDWFGLTREAEIGGTGKTAAVSLRLRSKLFKSSGLWKVSIVLKIQENLFNYAHKCGNIFYLVLLVVKTDSPHLSHFLYSMVVPNRYSITIRPTIRRKSALYTLHQLAPRITDALPACCAT